MFTKPPGAIRIHWVVASHRPRLCRLAVFPDGRLCFSLGAGVILEHRAYSKARPFILFSDSHRVAVAQPPGISRVFEETIVSDRDAVSGAPCGRPPWLCR